MEGPKGPGPDLKRGPPLPVLPGPYGSPSRRPQGCQGSAARAPRHQLPPIPTSSAARCCQALASTRSYSDRR